MLSTRKDPVLIWGPKGGWAAPRFYEEWERRDWKDAGTWEDRRKKERLSHDWPCPEQPQRDRGPALI